MRLSTLRRGSCLLLLVLIIGCAESESALPYPPGEPQSEQPKEPESPVMTVVFRGRFSQSKECIRIPNEKGFDEAMVSVTVCRISKVFEGNIKITELIRVSIPANAQEKVEYTIRWCIYADELNYIRESEAKGFTRMWVDRRPELEIIPPEKDNADRP